MPCAGGQHSDIVGHLFPATQVGSYPRPQRNGFDLGGEDILVALRRADCAEAFSDGVRAMIGDQMDAGRKALRHVPPERILPTTGRGQFALPRQIARGRLAAMAKAAEQLRAETG